MNSEVMMFRITLSAIVAAIGFDGCSDVPEGYPNRFLTSEPISLGNNQTIETGLIPDSGGLFLKRKFSNGRKIIYFDYIKDGQIESFHLYEPISQSFWTVNGYKNTKGIGYYREEAYPYEFDPEKVRKAQKDFRLLLDLIVIADSERGE